LSFFSIDVLSSAVGLRQSEQADAWRGRNYNGRRRHRAVVVLAEQTPAPAERTGSGAQDASGGFSASDRALSSCAPLASSMALVAGNAVGAGVLALPETSLPAGFGPSALVRSSHRRVISCLAGTVLTSLAGVLSFGAPVNSERCVVLGASRRCA
jgi:hypothetical protein